MTKFALPALFVCIFALFYSVTSQPDDAAPDRTELRAEPTQKLAETPTPQSREQSSVDAVNGVSAEQRLSDEVRANSEKIAQTATLRSDLLKLIQDSKSNNDKVAQNLLDQINAMRSEQVKSLKDANEAGGKAAQALRDEVTAAQANLVVQINDAIKANIDRSLTLTQRFDVMKKDIEDVKKNIDEDRQNRSNLSPGFALFAALAALALGPFMAYQLAANKLAGFKQQADATAARNQMAKSAEVGPPLAPSTPAEPEQEPSPNHEVEEARPLHEAEEARADEDDNGHPQAATDQEKV